MVHESAQISKPFTGFVRSFLSAVLPHQKKKKKKAVISILNLPAQALEQNNCTIHLSVHPPIHFSPAYPGPGLGSSRSFCPASTWSFCFELWSEMIRNLSSIIPQRRKLIQYRDCGWLILVFTTHPVHKGEQWRPAEAAAAFHWLYPKSTIHVQMMIMFKNPLMESLFDISKLFPH